MQTIQITYILSAQDFIDAHSARRAAEPAQRWSMRVLYALIALLVVAACAMYAIEPTKTTLVRLVPLFIFVVSWVTIVRVIPARYARRAFLRQPAAQAEQTTEFSEAGIRTRGFGGSESRIAWSQVLRCSESPRVFLLYVSPTLFVVYPKRAFTADQLAATREFFQSFVQKR